MTAEQMIRMEALKMAVATEGDTGAGHGLVLHAAEAYTTFVMTGIVTCHVEEGDEDEDPSLRLVTTRGTA